MGTITLRIESITQIQWLKIAKIHACWSHASVMYLMLFPLLLVQETLSWMLLMVSLLQDNSKVLSARQVNLSLLENLSLQEKAQCICKTLRATIRHKILSGRTLVHFSRSKLEPKIQDWTTYREGHSQSLGQSVILQSNHILHLLSWQVQALTRSIAIKIKSHDKRPIQKSYRVKSPSLTQVLITFKDNSLLTNQWVSLQMHTWAMVSVGLLFKPNRPFHQRIEQSKRTKCPLQMSTSLVPSEVQSRQG